MTYPHVPCFDARIDGELLLKVWVELAADAVVPLKFKLGLADADDADSVIEQLLYLYGTRRLERLCSGLSPEHMRLEEDSAAWVIRREDIHLLTELAQENPCDYRAPVGRDYFCTAAAPEDKTITIAIGGRRAAPTSIPMCRRCDLPSTDYVCSMLSHPGVVGLVTGAGIVARQLVEAMCNAGNEDAVADAAKCRAGGHACWRRTVEIEEPSFHPRSEPRDLPQALDTLGAFWRLSFGKDHPLLSFHTTTEIAELTLNCANREDFRSRMSALADVISKFSVHDDLLSESISDERRKGTLNRLQEVLKFQLPDELYGETEGAVRMLRNIVGVRVALQHSGAEGGLAKSLSKLQVKDAPPDWAGAWDKIRTLAADALVELRTVLGRHSESV